MRFSSKNYTFRFKLLVSSVSVSVCKRLVAVRFEKRREHRGDASHAMQRWEHRRDIRARYVNNPRGENNETFIIFQKLINIFYGRI